MKILPIILIICSCIMIFAYHDLHTENKTVTVKAYSGGQLIGTWQSARIKWRSRDWLRFEDVNGKKVNINGDYIIEYK